MQCWNRFVFFVSFLIGAAAATGPSQAQKKPVRQFVPGEIIIGFKSEKAAEEVLKELQGVESSGGVRTRGIARSSSVKVERLDGKSARITFQFGTGGARSVAALRPLEDYAEGLREDPRVEYAHPNWIMKIQRDRIKKPIYLEDLKLKPRFGARSAGRSGPNDTVFRNGLHWHYAKPPLGMNAIAAWRAPAKGMRSVVVAVVDTGILPNHPDIKGSGNLLPGYDFISKANYEVDKQKGRDANPTDPGDRCPAVGSNDSWHGTHVAGTIGAGRTNNGRGIAGINWAISVLPVRVLGRCGGTIDDLAAAIRWSAGLPVKGVPQNNNKADIINLSLGIGGACVAQDYGLLISAINAARKAGSTIVVAAGNADVDIKTVTPAGCKAVISVAASDQRGHLTPYSNYGNVTIMAPGGDLKRDDDQDGKPDGVWSLVTPSKQRPSGVAAYEGTSMATAHVSAAIALAIAKKPALKWKPEEITALLTRTSTELPKKACSKSCGPGLLNADAMIQPAVLVSTRPKNAQVPPLPRQEKSRARTATVAPRSALAKPVKTRRRRPKVIRRKRSRKRTSLPSPNWAEQYFQKLN